MEVPREKNTYNLVLIVDCALYSFYGVVKFHLFLLRLRRLNMNAHFMIPTHRNWHQC